MDRRRSAWCAGAAVACAVIALSGCTQPTQSPHVGDCFSASDATLTGKDSVTDITTVRCTSSHNSEVVGVHRLDDGDFPQTETLVAKAQTLCRQDFLDYVGIDYTDSAYDLYPLVPTKETWETEDARSIVCVALALPPIGFSLKDAREDAAH